MSTEKETVNQTEKESSKEGFSRRDFLKTTTAGAGAAAAAVGVTSQTLGATVPGLDIPSITIPKEVVGRLDEKIQVGSFEGNGMTGAEVFAKVCKDENLAGLFCCPGNYTVINAIAAAGIPAYGGRTEGAMCAAADGFSRATGEVVATSGTEGPGFTHMIMNIASANAARTPLLVLASNMRIAGDDREAFIQTGYQQPTTTGMKKYGKRLITPNRVHEYAGHAFRNLKSGVPGPVHLDFPAEVARARFTDSSELTDFYDKTKYRSEARAHISSKDMEAALDLIKKAERPILLAGQGVFQRKAWDALHKAAEKNELVVCDTGPSKGHFSVDHRLSAALAPDALMSADLVIFVGQYCMPSPGEYRFNPDVKTIRVHPEQVDLGRNWPIDVGIVCDEKVFMEELAAVIPTRKRDAWVAEVASARKSYEDGLDDLYKLGLKYSKETSMLHPAVIAKEVHDFFYKGDIDPKQTVSGMGGWTSGLYAGKWLRSYRPGQMIPAPYQYAAIGPDMSMTMGAGAAVKEGVGCQEPYKGAPVLCFTSDAGIAYSMFELDTCLKYKIPVITLVYNNNSWGMWPSAARSSRSMHMYLFQENLRYDQLAQGMGAHGEYCQTQDELKGALQRSYKVAAETGQSSLINCQAIKEFTSARDYPPGVSMNPEPGVGAFVH
jgi:thiamine pyrophosphate-dependent acetolactate synthase large subunit-like protein